MLDDVRLRCRVDGLFEIVRLNRLRMVSLELRQRSVVSSHRGGARDLEQIAGLVPEAAVLGRVARQLGGIPKRPPIPRSRGLEASHDVVGLHSP